MDTTTLHNYLDNNSFSRESLLVNYSFEKIENGIVFNEIHDTDRHYPEPGCLNAAIYPGILVSCADHSQFDAYKGCCSMGYFDSTTAVRIGYKLPHNEWTVFLNYNNRVARNDRDRAEVLFSSMPTPTAASGFNVGLNGANRLYFEYVNTLGEKKNVVLPDQIENYNIISIAKSANDVTISNHDPFSRKDYSIYYAFDDVMADSDVWTLGNFTASYEAADHKRYRGFNGYIDDFILFNVAYSEDQRNILSEGLYYTGTIPASSKETTVTVETISGAPTQVSVPSEQAIVGYSMEAIPGVTNICGSPITVCEQVAIMGQGYKKILDFARVNVEQKVTEIIPEVKLYNEEYSAKYAEKNIVFLKPVDSNDIYEVYSQSAYDGNLNKPLTFNNLLGTFLIPLSDSTKNLSLYANGIRQESNTDYIIEGTDVSSSDSAVPFDSSDSSVYDVLESEVNVLNWAGENCTTYSSSDGVTCEQFFITGEKYLNKDIYFQGQKLVSGMDYSVGIDETDGITTGVHIDVIAGGVNGKYSFVPRSSLFETRYTGTMSAFDMLSFNLRNEQVWLNGKRQIEGVDYVKTSNYSLLNNNLRLESKPHVIYNNNEVYYNL